jgi:5'(3')-deoxyribonucleotidase
MNALKVEFVSERKVIRTLSSIPEAQKVMETLIRVYNKWQVSDDEPEVLWENVARYLPVDPFLPLSMRIKSDNKIVYKKVIWKNTVK